MPSPGRPLEFYLAALQKQYARCRLIPSYDVMMKIFQLHSKNAVFKVLRRLEEEHFIERCDEASGQTRWVPSRRFYERTLTTQTVRAGHPSPATEISADLITLDEYLIEKPATTMFVPVRGDSMEGAGIFEGDLAVVETSSPACDGDVVLALVDGESTLKRLRHEGVRMWLEAANPAYPDIHPTDELRIQGVLVGLVRKVHR